MLMREYYGHDRAGEAMAGKGSPQNSSQGDSHASSGLGRVTTSCVRAGRRAKRNDEGRKDLTVDGRGPRGLQVLRGCEVECEGVRVCKSAKRRMRANTWTLFVHTLPLADTPLASPRTGNRGYLRS